ncbi:MAG: Alcohol dehydrogenase GroES domain protein [Myxococcaceae bacterium]|nr:Alcohol dehydrogenase GroES domain protein [Myxococcaceae bacterium]
MAKMRAVQVSRRGGPLELVEREVPEPGAGSVRIKVEACGVCHSDSVTVEGLMPGIEYPRIPGHEVVGTIDAVGRGVSDFAIGQRVGVGWHGGQDGTCDACRRGNFFACRLHLVTGVTTDGGYADYMVARSEALARFPDGLAPADAAPLLCAGITTFNGLRNSGARPGDLVAVLGIGGLGHLAVQYAARMGFSTVAIARDRDIEPLARELGASHFIDAKTSDAAAELTKLGGAKVILGTAPSGKAMSALLTGLAPGGRLVVIGASAELIEASPTLLIFNDLSISGWYSGTAIDSEDTLRFSKQTGVHSMNEVFPLERAADAYQRMMSGKARFRDVLVTA